MIYNEHREIGDNETARIKCVKMTCEDTEKVIYLIEMWITEKGHIIMRQPAIICELNFDFQAIRRAISEFDEFVSKMEF